eukprot:TRINITY_DN1546_c0_g1_i1.p1 TRINITY_DN1546_c0_g1~~TRINITY_DN1546_c0_g1_i1.p1  ORF type:complete len:2146 (+),score=339.98 TRINITY_DN1546_c0_g1_i1:34-6471(+)
MGVYEYEFYNSRVDVITFYTVHCTIQFCVSIIFFYFYVKCFGMFKLIPNMLKADKNNVKKVIAYFLSFLCMIINPICLSIRSYILELTKSLKFDIFPGISLIIISFLLLIPVRNYVKEGKLSGFDHFMNFLQLLSFSFMCSGFIVTYNLFFPKLAIIVVGFLPFITSLPIFFVHVNYLPILSIRKLIRSAQFDDVSPVTIRRLEETLIFCLFCLSMGFMPGIISYLFNLDYAPFFFVSFRIFAPIFISIIFFPLLGDLRRASIMALYTEILFVAHLIVCELDFLNGYRFSFFFVLCFFIIQIIGSLGVKNSKQQFFYENEQEQQFYLSSTEYRDFNALINVNYFFNSKIFLLFFYFCSFVINEYLLQKDPAFNQDISDFDFKFIFIGISLLGIIPVIYALFSWILKFNEGEHNVTRYKVLKLLQKCDIDDELTVEEMINYLKTDDENSAENKDVICIFNKKTPTFIIRYMIKAIFSMIVSIGVIYLVFYAFEKSLRAISWPDMVLTVLLAIPASLSMLLQLKMMDILDYQFFRSEEPILQPLYTFPRILLNLLMIFNFGIQFYVLYYCSFDSPSIADMVVVYGSSCVFFLMVIIQSFNGNKGNNYFSLVNSVFMLVIQEIARWETYQCDLEETLFDEHVTGFGIACILFPLVHYLLNVYCFFYDKNINNVAFIILLLMMLHFVVVLPIEYMIFFKGFFAKYFSGFFPVWIALTALIPLWLYISSKAIEKKNFLKYAFIASAFIFCLVFSYYQFHQISVSSSYIFALIMIFFAVCTLNQYSISRYKITTFFGSSKHSAKVYLNEHLFPSLVFDKRLKTFVRNKKHELILLASWFVFIFLSFSLIFVTLNSNFVFLILGSIICLEIIYCGFKTSVLEAFLRYYFCFSPDLISQVVDTMNGVDLNGICRIVDQMSKNSSVKRKKNFFKDETADSSSLQSIIEEFNEWAVIKNSLKFIELEHMLITRHLNGEDICLFNNFDVLDNDEITYIIETPHYDRLVTEIRSKRDAENLYNKNLLEGQMYNISIQLIAFHVKEKQLLGKFFVNLIETSLVELEQRNYFINQYIEECRQDFDLNKVLKMSVEEQEMIREEYRMFLGLRQRINVANTNGAVKINLRLIEQVTDSKAPNSTLSLSDHNIGVKVKYSPSHKNSVNVGNRNTNVEVDGELSHNCDSSEIEFPGSCVKETNYTYNDKNEVSDLETEVVMNYQTDDSPGIFPLAGVGRRGSQGPGVLNLGIGAFNESIVYPNSSVSDMDTVVSVGSLNNTDDYSSLHSKILYSNSNRERDTSVESKYSSTGGVLNEEEKGSSSVDFNQNNVTDNSDQIDIGNSLLDGTMIQSRIMEESFKQLHDLMVTEEKEEEMEGDFLISPVIKTIDANFSEDEVIDESVDDESKNDEEDEDDEEDDNNIVEVNRSNLFVEENYFPVNSADNTYIIVENESKNDQDTAFKKSNISLSASSSSNSKSVKSTTPLEITSERRNRLKIKQDSDLEDNDDDIDTNKTYTNTNTDASPNTKTNSRKKTRRKKKELSKLLKSKKSLIVNIQQELKLNKKILAKLRTKKFSNFIDELVIIFNKYQDIKILLKNCKETYDLLDVTEISSIFDIISVLCTDCIESLNTLKKTMMYDSAFQSRDNHFIARNMEFIELLLLNEKQKKTDKDSDKDNDHYLKHFCNQTAILNEAYFKRMKKCTNIRLIHYSDIFDLPTIKLTNIEKIHSSLFFPLIKPILLAIKILNRYELLDSLVERCCIKQGMFLFAYYNQEHVDYLILDGYAPFYYNNELNKYFCLYDEVDKDCILPWLMDQMIYSVFRSLDTIMDQFSIPLALRMLFGARGDVMICKNVLETRTKCAHAFIQLSWTSKKDGFFCLCQTENVSEDDVVSKRIDLDDHFNEKDCTDSHLTRHGLPSNTYFLVRKTVETVNNSRRLKLLNIIPLIESFECTKFNGEFAKNSPSWNHSLHQQVFASVKNEKIMGYWVTFQEFLEDFQWYLPSITLSSMFKYTITGYWHEETAQYLSTENFEKQHLAPQYLILCEHVNKQILEIHIELTQPASSNFEKENSPKFPAALCVWRHSHVPVDGPFQAENIIEPGISNDGSNIYLNLSIDLTDGFVYSIVPLLLEEAGFNPKKRGEFTLAIYCASQEVQVCRTNQRI